MWKKLVIDFHFGKLWTTMHCYGHIASAFIVFHVGYLHSNVVYHFSNVIFMSFFSSQFTCSCMTKIRQLSDTQPGARCSSLRCPGGPAFHAKWYSWAHLHGLIGGKWGVSGVGDRDGERRRLIRTFSVSAQFTALPGHPACFVGTNMNLAGQKQRRYAPHENWAAHTQGFIGEPPEHCDVAQATI